MTKKSRPVSGARPSASSRQTVAATLQLVMEMENIVDRKRIAIFHKSNTQLLTQFKKNTILDFQGVK
jgi:hypothetical protein